MLDPAVLPVTVYTGDYTTGVAFTVIGSGRITHLVSHNHDFTNAGVLRLYDDATREQLATMKVPPVAGWQNLELPTPVPVIAGRRYLMSFHADGEQATTYPYQDGVPVSKSPNLVDMRGTYENGNAYPTYDGGQYYWLDVIFQKGLDLYDDDTQRFLDASGLNESYALALDGLVLGLKAHGLWSKMAAIYPFIGGTADLHKWNLKDPRDTDDAYRLSFIGGIGGIHTDALGYQANEHAGTVVNGGYADTHLIPRGIFGQEDTSLAFFSLADMPVTQRCDMGCFAWEGGQQRFHIIARYAPSEFYFGMAEDGASNTYVPASDGLFVATRNGSIQSGYRNGVLVGETNVPSIWLPNVSVWVGGINSFAERSDLPCGFASIGTGLSAADNANLNTVVRNYQIALGRVAWSPEVMPGLMAWIDPAQDTYVEGERIVTYREHSPAHLTFTTDGVNGPIFHTMPPRLEFPNPNVGLVAANVNLGLDGLTFVLVDKAADLINFPMKIVSGTDNDGWEFRSDGAAIQIVERYATSGIVFSTPFADSVGVNALHILRVQGGVRSDVWLNNALHQGGAAPGHNTPLDLWIARRAGGYHWRGEMYEVLAFAGPVSDADLTKLREYLIAKHALYGVWE